MMSYVDTDIDIEGSINLFITFILLCLNYFIFQYKSILVL